jgi:hypothetical protein
VTRRACAIAAALAVLLLFAPTAQAQNRGTDPLAGIFGGGDPGIRLLLACLILYATWKAARLFVSMAMMAVLAMVALVGGLAFAPAMAIAAFVPDRGHGIVRKWGAFLLTSLLMKVAYGFALGVLLSTSFAVTTLAGNVMSPLLAYFVVTMMWAGIWNHRHAILRGVGSARAVSHLDRGGRGHARTVRQVLHPVQTVRSYVPGVLGGAGAGYAAGRASRPDAPMSAGTPATDWDGPEPAAPRADPPPPPAPVAPSPARPVADRARIDA